MKERGIKPNPPVSRPPQTERPQPPPSQQQILPSAPYPPDQQLPSYNDATSMYPNQYAPYPVQPVVPPAYPTGP